MTTTRAIVSLGLSALVLGGSTVGCAMGGGGSGIASVGSRVGAATDRLAASNAKKAGKALSRGDATTAIDLAEAAVAGAPDNAAYRMLLARSYMKAGRFDSAKAAFADALQLSPDNGEAALNLALAQTATGDWGVARGTLEQYSAIVPATDRGLALALAGDPSGAVQLLTAAARTPEATATTRQNLALALALSGQWQMARVVAAADMSPADVDRRMAEWATFATPQTASDQVSALLGVQPVVDPGQPVALALNATPAPAPAAIAQAADAAPVAVASAEPAATIDVPVPAATPLAVAMAADERIEREPGRTVVQDVPERVAARSPRTATRLALAAPGVDGKPVATPRKAAPANTAERKPGRWYVQIGAFNNAGVAQDAWSRAKRRFADLQQHAPTGMHYAGKAGHFYRLSVGGFQRSEAVRLCGRYRAQGGACFVRAGAGDRMAQWLKPNRVQVASR